MSLPVFKLDKRTSYWQVEIKEQDKHKTAFSVCVIYVFTIDRNVWEKYILGTV